MTATALPTTDERAAQILLSWRRAARPLCLQRRRSGALRAPAAGPAASTTLALALVALASSTALARTPTPTAVPTITDGPSPTVTRTGSPTPTGTVPMLSVTIAVSPNPARSGQRVTLTASPIQPFTTFRWSQIGGGAALQIEDADQPTAHFTAPAVTQPSDVLVRVTASGPRSGEATTSVTLVPADAVIARVGSGSAPPGTTLPIDVVLQPLGLTVTRLEHELDFTRYAPVADRGGGVPDCEPGPALQPTAASFAFVPDGCTATQTCTGVRAMLTTRDPIPDGVAYRCEVVLVDEPSPPEEGCSHRLTCGSGQARTPSGTALALLCPEGADGFASANYALRPLSFAFRAEPAAPNVDDTVHVTFTVEGEGGLPRYVLSGAEPILHGTTTALPGGPLGSVSFDLHADCPGTAPLQLSVDYETTFGCPGNTFFNFTFADSPVFPLIVREPGSFRVTGHVAELPDGCQGSARRAVRLDPLGWVVGSDAAGEFAFDAVPPGDYTLSLPEGCGAFQCWPQQPVRVVDQDVAIALCPQRLAGDACIGDCNLDGVVRIDELTVGVSMALGRKPFAACPAIDTNGDGVILVDEVIRAVAASLLGCP